MKLNFSPNLLLLLTCSLLLSCASAQRLSDIDVRPYTVETSHQKLVKDYPFIDPITFKKEQSIVISENVSYKKVKQADLQMDIYQPKSVSGKRPAVLLIHGGGWISGSRQNQAVMAQKLAQKGFVAATVSYRLSREAKYPAAVNDIQDALTFIKKNADQYQINTAKIAILGASAGAQLATLIGVKHPEMVQAIVNIDGVVSFIHPEAEEGEIAGFWLGGMKDEHFTTWKEASPLEYVNRQTPPTLFINSAQDRFHAGRDDMIKKLTDYGIYSEVRTILNSPHSFWLAKPWFSQTVNYTVNFLNETFSTNSDSPYRTIQVAKDGSGEFTTIQEAVDATRDLGPGEVLIQIKNGIYHEKLVIPSWKHQLTLRGESKDGVVIENDDYSGKMNEQTGNEYNTFTSYTVLVTGDDITIENLTIKNSSCGEGQAVALHVEGDRFIISDANILGCQDTVYAAKEGSRQYYLNCTIEGTTDFIFGEATALFDNCEIRSLKNSYITAAATPENQPFGFVFRNCTLTATEEAKEVFLGRPWRPFAKTVFLNTNMGGHIIAEGWHHWPGDEMFPDKEKTAYYAEYGSFGEGSSAEERIGWSHQLTIEEASQYTIEKIFHQKSKWNPNE